MVKRLNPRIEGWGIVYRGEYRRVLNLNYYYYNYIIIIIALIIIALFIVQKMKFNHLTI